MRIAKQINKITRLTVLSKRNYWSLDFSKRNHSPNKTVADASRGYPTRTKHNMIRFDVWLKWEDDRNLMQKLSCYLLALNYQQLSLSTHTELKVEDVQRFHVLCNIRKIKLKSDNCKIDDRAVQMRTIIGGGNGGTNLGHLFQFAADQFSDAGALLSAQHMTDNRYPTGNSYKKLRTGTGTPKSFPVPEAEPPKTIRILEPPLPKRTDNKYPTGSSYKKLRTRTGTPKSFPVPEAEPPKTIRILEPPLPKRMNIQLKPNINYKACSTPPYLTSTKYPKTAHTTATKFPSLITTIPTVQLISTVNLFPSTTTHSLGFPQKVIKTNTEIQITTIAGTATAKAAAIDKIPNIKPTVNEA
ncbi:hypothetical protein LXL04_019917 [Taraxacum kok-saghyz]